MADRISIDAKQQALIIAGFEDFLNSLSDEKLSELSRKLPRRDFPKFSYEAFTHFIKCENAPHIPA